MRKNGFHVEFDTGDEASKEQLSEKELFERLTHIGALRQRMFSALYMHLVTSV